MAADDLMSKIRRWDNICARWMMRHFYILFFELVLVIIFFVFLFNAIHAIDLSRQITTNNMVEQLLSQLSINTLIIVMLLLLNSFWLLFMFSGINRIRALLKDINFQLLRQKQKR